MKTSQIHIDRSWPQGLVGYLLFVVGILLVIAALISGGN